ncbi:hypothetical protein [Paenibacillus rhizophilus]|uniref:Lipoprotein n=1 Tax=Paenibacillus rhizophilus TaxID=1850366 RepID=A0A3N9P7Q1_9BACL|nr:hypothetical protein [Paenibacillus rhizophilus]RQW12248.1 hypothetical protein EH198_07785 [Paenibacillus rhizophilus]
MRKLMIFILFLLVLAGCNLNQGPNNTTRNPTAEEVLRMDRNANIFMYKNTIYNAGIDWVNKLELSKDKEITEIIELREDGKEFKDGTANKLVVGTKIFSVKERNDILIAETKDGDIRFYKLVEG